MVRGGANDAVSSIGRGRSVPVIAGMMAGALGTAQVMTLLAVLPALVVVGVCFLQETAPLVLSKRNK